MQRKYSVSSVSFVIPMTVGFSSNENDESYSIQVHVDMMNGEIYFLDDKIDGIDYEDLKEEIFLEIYFFFFFLAKLLRKIIFI